MHYVWDNPQSTHSLWLSDTLTAIQHTIAMCINKQTDTHFRHIFLLFFRILCASADFRLCLPLCVLQIAHYLTAVAANERYLKTVKILYWILRTKKNDFATEVICRSFLTRTLETLMSVFILYSTKHLRYIGLVNTHSGFRFLSPLHCWGRLPLIVHHSICDL